ncbi:hypothetical protein [Clostridium sp. Cult2]|uniref:hypothetical protein n=1 Tax=Clostridium sp. Cult2 TaxID=2079003 RepID=UPI001F3DF601|nr:hypothetical protein [Clostridium sp. Cult2]
MADSIDSLNEEKNPMEKGRRIVENFKNFMDLCKGDIEGIGDVYKEMKSSIYAFLEKK